MLALLLQRKDNTLIKTLDCLSSLLSQGTDEAKNPPSLGIPGLQLPHLLRIDLPLREIDVPLLSVNPDDAADIVFIDLLPNKKHLLIVLGLASPAILSKRNHPL